jgi:hypothetical protein
MKFARWVFLAAGLYGLAVLLPMYFMEARINAQMPPAISHPEFYYGFVGVGVAWQLVFLQISRNPLGLHRVMLAGVVEKLSFGLAAFALAAQGRLHGQLLAGAAIDLLLAGLFVLAYLGVRKHAMREIENA